VETDDGSRWDVSVPSRDGHETLKHETEMRPRRWPHQLDLGVTWVCIHDLTWHQNDLKVD